MLSRTLFLTFSSTAFAWWHQDTAEPTPSPCTPAQAAVRQPDGTCNNLAHPNWGSSEKPYGGRRDYEDHLSIPRQSNRPLARLVDYQFHAPGNHVDIYCNEALVDCDSYDLEVPSVNKEDPAWLENTVSSSLSTLAQGFGQFVGHDITMFGEPENCPSPNANIPEIERAYLPEQDRFRWFPEDIIPPPAGPPGTLKNQTFHWMNTHESPFVIGSDGVKRSINFATGYLDLSVVYGAIPERIEAVREDFSTGTGRLKTSDLFVSTDQLAQDVSLPLLHPDVETNRTYADFPPTYEELGKPLRQCELDMLHLPRTRFYCGDARCGTNVLLLTFHISYLRSHNNIADELKAANPTWTGEELYHEARRINIARYQSSAKAYFRMLTGEHKRYVYQGYDSQKDATLDVVGAFTVRFHTIVADEIRFVDGCNKPTGGINPPFPGAPPIPGLPYNAFQFSGQSTRVVRDIYLYQYAGGIGNMIRGMSREPAGEMDHIVSESIRIHLASAHDLTGISITGFTIHRSRMDGVESYNQVRHRLLGQPLQHLPGCWCADYDFQNHRCARHRLACFKKITKDERLARKLQELYGNVNEVDMWTGVQAEKNLPGAQVGKVGRAILLDAFDKMMHGDRFWYENPDYFSAQEIAHSRAYSLKDQLVDSFPEVADLETFLPASALHLPPYDDFGVDHSNPACAAGPPF